MPTSEQRGLVAKAHLSADEMTAGQSLVTLCNANEKLDLKVGLGEPPEAATDVDAPPRVFYYYGEGGDLLGLCALDGDDREVELCGMVHPDYRRQGIGRVLLDAALRECRRRGVQRLLMICEDASWSGMSFIAVIGARYEFGEHRLLLDTQVRTPPPLPAPPDASFTLERAGESDIATLASVTSAAFEHREGDAQAHIQADMTDPAQRFYLGRIGDTPVGSLKIYEGNGRAYIYAFGVVPAFRGKGWGRQILLRTISMLIAEGHTKIALEVETNNTAALMLYRSSGFEEVTTYGYYRVDL